MKYESITVKICEAIEFEDLSEIIRLVQNFPQLLRIPVNPKGMEALHYAAENGKDRAILQLLELGSDVNSFSCSMTALDFAILAAPFCTIELLLKHGADPNAISFSGETPVLLAARDRQLVDEPDEQSVPDLLISYGATLDVHSAVCLGRLDKVRELLKANPRAIQESPKSEEILLNKWCYRSFELLSLLLQHDADPNCGEGIRGSALESVVSMIPCDAKIVKELLDHGGNPNSWVVCRNMSILRFAKWFGQPQYIIELIESYGGKEY